MSGDLSCEMTSSAVQVKGHTPSELLPVPSAVPQFEQPAGGGVGHTLGAGVRTPGTTACDELVILHSFTNTLETVISFIAREYFFKVLFISVTDKQPTTRSH